MNCYFTLLCQFYICWRWLLVKVICEMIKVHMMFNVQLLCFVICDFYCIVDDAIIPWLTLHKNCCWVRRSFFFIIIWKPLNLFSMFNLQHVYVRALTAFLCLLLNWAAKQSPKGKASEYCNVSNLCYENDIEDWSSYWFLVFTFWIKLRIWFDFIDKTKGIISVVSHQIWT